VSDPTEQDDKTMIVTTVEGKKQGYLQRDITWAEKVRKLQEIFMYPSLKSFIATAA